MPTRAQRCRAGALAVWVTLGAMPDMAQASSPDAAQGPVVGPPANPPDAASPDAASADAIQFMAQAALLSDYRFRGTSYSLGEPVAQASLVAAHESGAYVGGYVSSLGNHPIYGAVEVDLFAGWAKGIAPAITADVTLYYYYYPDANPAFPNTDSFEAAAQLTGEFGTFSPKIGVWYAWKQAAFAGSDNLYLFGDLVWRVPGTPLEARVHGGYTHGAYSIDPDRTTIDWSAALFFRTSDTTRLGVEYIGTSGPNVKNYTDDTIVASLSVNF